jgi:hypothetical protein
LFLLASALFALFLVFAGLDWTLALVFTALVILYFLGVGRISAETGHLFIQPFWQPAALIVGLIGLGGIGPSAALILFLVSTVLLVDPRESLMPFLLNGFRMLDAQRVRLSRPAAFGGVALVLGLAVALVVTLYLKYDQGTDLRYGWASRMVPRFAFDEALQIKRQLQARGTLAEAESVSGFARLGSIRPDEGLVAGFGIALALYVGLSAARLRFVWWPLHPVLLLLWGTYGGARFAVSFLVGFAIKWVAVTYGGDKVCRRLRPFMVGVVAAEMIFSIATSVIGLVYYLFTNTSPPNVGWIFG